MVSHSKIILMISVIIFSLSFGAGYFTDLILNPKFNPPNFIPDYREDITVCSILTQNLKVCFLLLLGSITFGASTLQNLVYNGYNIGYTVVGALKFGLSLSEILMLTLPHCIFEIPAIIIAGAAGFKIPYEIVKYLTGKKEQILTKEDIKEYLTLALISIILIVIAAWIEANITLKIAKAMLKTKGI
jgi:uncharacterized membrane protein SpoIIM required for sporulation